MADERFEVVQVSDTHLGAAPPLLCEGFRRAAAHVRRLAPRLVVNTGDASLDGAEDEADLTLARELHEELDTEVVVLPGNHDVGELPGAAPGLEADVTEATCARFRDCFGDDKFVRDVGGWRLIGINAQVLGTALPSAAAQWRHLQDAIASAEGRKLALFVHKPLFIDSPGEPQHGLHSLPAPASRRIHELFGGSDLRLCASGHLHRHRARKLGEVTHAWAPSTGFVSAGLDLPGEAVVGFLLHRFGPDGVETEVVCPEDMVSHQFLDHPELYPAYQARARARQG